MKRKIISLFTLLALSFTLLASCGEEEIKNREYDPIIVEKAARGLISESEKLNKLLWGEGIKYDPNPAYASGYYYKADEFSLDNYGIITVEDINKLMRKTFSEGYTNQIFSSTVFSSAKDANDNIVHFARYMQKVDGNSPEYIQVYSKWEPFLYDTAVYDYNSIKATHSKGERVYVEISCEVVDSETNKKEKKIVSVALIEESIGWRIDSPTYCEIENVKK